MSCRGNNLLRRVEGGRGGERDVRVLLVLVLMLMLEERRRKRRRKIGIQRGWFRGTFKFGRLELRRRRDKRMLWVMRGRLRSM